MAQRAAVNTAPPPPNLNLQQLQNFLLWKNIWTVFVSAICVKEGPQISCELQARSFIWTRETQEVRQENTLSERFGKNMAGTV